MPEGVLDANDDWRPWGESLSNQHQYADALDLSTGILEHHTVDPDTWVDKARSVLGLSRPEEALAGANYGPTRDIDTVQGYRVRGNRLLGLECYDEELACFDRVLEQGSFIRVL